MSKAEDKHRHKHAWLYEAELNHAQQNEDMLKLKSAEQLSIDSRSNDVIGWKYEAKNALMYVPDGMYTNQECKLI